MSLDVNSKGRNGRRFSHLIFEHLPTTYTHNKARGDEELAKDVKDQDIICVHSLSLDPTELTKIEGVSHYEERSLFAILFLRHPSTRIVYVTSNPLDERIVQYYLSLVKEISGTEIGKRLIFLSVNDSSSKSLTTKILERPRFINRIKNIIRPGKSCMLCYATTTEEKTLATRLGVTMIGCDPAFDYLGSKSGSREIFQACDVPHPVGVTRKTDSRELACAITELLHTNPTISCMVVKLDQGFSGHGNAVLDLSQLSGTATPADVIAQMAKMKFVSPTETWECFEKKIHVLGAIAEEYISGEASSPSVQGYITLQGDVELLSSHDQILDGQIYHGCIFPATQAPKCCVRMNDYSAQVGHVLAEKGARGYFGVDFLVSKDSPLEPHALEINLRQCGTTHPFFTMKLLTGGLYDKQTGLFYSNKGTTKFYRATDNLHLPQYCGLLPSDLLEFATARNFMYSSSTQTGVVFHLLGALSQYGKMGFTAIGDSPEEAATLAKKVGDMLDYETLEKTITRILPQSRLATNSTPTTTLLSPQHSVLTFGGETNVATHILITSCIHGDEQCGLHAINQLIEEGCFDNLPDTLRLTVMCANPLGATKGVRFVDKNLNRCILPHLFENGGYESFRARTIANYIYDSDVFLDIHSTSAPTDAMCLPAANSSSEQLARQLPVKYVIEELAHATEVRGTTIDWAYFHHKTAVSVECGQHNAPESVQVAKQIVQALVEIYSNNRSDNKIPQPAPTPNVMRCLGCEKVMKGFTYRRTVTPFEHVKFGEVLADDERGPITCPFDLYKQGALVIMPTSLPYIGEEAFFWVVPTEVLEEEK